MAFDPQTLSSHAIQLQTLQENAPWIRSLGVLEHSSSHQPIFWKHCTMLESLSLQCQHNEHPDQIYWDSLQSLLNQNVERLGSLTLTNWGAPPQGKNRSHIPIDHPFKTFARHSNLRSLTLLKFSVEGKHMRHFWSVYSQLESLEIRSTSLSRPDCEYPTLQRGGSTSDDNGRSEAITVTDGALERLHFLKLRKLILENVAGIGALDSWTGSSNLVH
ncbi:hypothetical protein B0O80DRAFT_294119 [Mortierella sp. GBAus27b]|nr:hypothetical protein B0O80DRAFT_294119 [Mortierella sp. GBAus27b]